MIWWAMGQCRVNPCFFFFLLLILSLKKEDTTKLMIINIFFGEKKVFLCTIAAQKKVRTVDFLYIKFIKVLTNKYININIFKRKILWQIIMNISTLINLGFWVKIQTYVTPALQIYSNEEEGGLGMIQSIGLVRGDCILTGHQENNKHH